MNFVLATMFFLMCPMLAIYLVLRAIRSSSIADDLPNLLREYKLPIFAISLVCIGIIHWLVLQNRFVYYWDYGGYWTASYEFVRQMYSTPMEGLEHFRHSLRHDDYNLLLPSLIGIPLKIFGFDFTTYVTINAICFFIPSCIIFAAVAYRITRPLDSRWFVGFFALAATFSSMYEAFLQGYIDSAVLIPLGLSFLLILDYKPSEWNSEQKSRSLILSILFLGIFLSRRYFAYYVVSSFAILLALSIRKWIQDSSRDSRRIIVKNLAVTGGVAFAILMIFFSPIAIHSLMTDYASQYSASYLPLDENLVRLEEFFGIAPFIIAILAFTDRKYLKPNLIFASSILMTLFLFYRVQRLDIHQNYVIAGQILMLMCVAIYSAQKFLKIGFVILYALNFLHMTWILPFGDELQPLLSYRHWIMRRDDIPRLHALVDAINEENSGGTVYILSSSIILNSDLLDALDKPYGKHPVKNFTRTMDIDLRDGFPIEFPRAEIVVVATPIQTHLAEGSQEVVRFLGELVLDSDSQIGRHFRFIREIELGEGVIAKIYRRVSDFIPEDRQFLDQYFSNRYPEHENIFHDRIFAEQSRTE